MIDHEKSNMLILQLSISQQHDPIEGPTLAYAIMDCITRGAHSIELKGESMRLKPIKN
jgi:hypothetical protein